MASARPAPRDPVLGPPTYEEWLWTLQRDLRVVRRELRNCGVPKGILDGAMRRARQTGRKTTGASASNRQLRWQLAPTDRNYADAAMCYEIELRLLAMLLEFDNAPAVSVLGREVLERHLGRACVPGTHRDDLLLETLDYAVYAAEVAAARPGQSNFHIGHTDPTLRPMHTPENTRWRTARSNLMQGDMTLPQARGEIVKLVARYFDLNVTIAP